MHCRHDISVIWRGRQHDALEAVVIETIFTTSKPDGEGSVMLSIITINKGLSKREELEPHFSNIDL